MNVPGLEFQKITSRFNVIHANFYAAHKMAEAGFNVIDLHYYSLLQTFRRNPDGVHWSPETNRWNTNAVLTHVSLACGFDLPNRNENDYALKRVVYMSRIAKGDLSAKECTEILENLEKMVKNIMEIKPDKKPKGKRWWEKIHQLPSVTELLTELIKSAS